MWHATSPRDEVKYGTVPPREGCTFLTVLCLSEGTWRSELARMLLGAPYTMCYMANVGTCFRYWEKAEEGTLVIACSVEVARFVGTLPFFAKLRSLRMGETMLMPLSACELLTYVCVSNDWPARTIPEFAKVAKILAMLPALRAVRLGTVWDPSLITASCSRSLVSFECNSCGTCDNSMPRLERFICNGQFAYCDRDGGIESIVTALRGCVALRSIYIKDAYYTLPLFKVLLTLPHLKEAYLPDQRPRSREGTFVTHGMVCEAVVGTIHGSAMLLPVLSYLLRVRTLNRVARVVGRGHGMLQWVVFSAPSPTFRHIWGALVKIATTWRTQREEDDVMYGDVMRNTGIIS